MHLKCPSCFLEKLLQLSFVVKLCARIGIPCEKCQQTMQSSEKKIDAPVFSLGNLQNSPYSWGYLILAGHLCLKLQALLLSYVSFLTLTAEIKKEVPRGPFTELGLCQDMPRLAPGPVHLWPAGSDIPQDSWHLGQISPEEWILEPHEWSFLQTWQCNVLSCDLKDVSFAWVTPKIFLVSAPYS